MTSSHERTPNDTPKMELTHRERMIGTLAFAGSVGLVIFGGCSILEEEPGVDTKVIAAISADAHSDEDDHEQDVTLLKDIELHYGNMAITKTGQETCLSTAEAVNDEGGHISHKEHDETVIVNQYCSDQLPDELMNFLITAADGGFKGSGGGH